MKEIDIKVGGYVFPGNEICIFCAYLKELLQHRMRQLPQGSVEKYELNICSMTLGKPGEAERTSLYTAKFFSQRSNHRV